MTVRAVFPFRPAVLGALLAAAWAFGPAVARAASDVDSAAAKLAKGVVRAVPADARLFVADLGNLDNRTPYFGRYLADKIQIQIAKRGPGFDVVDRRRLDLTLEEIRLGQSGALDEAGASRIGKLLGATVMAYGTVTEGEDAIEVDVKIRELATGRILGGASERIKKSKRVSALLVAVLESEREKQAEAERLRKKMEWEIGEERLAIRRRILREEREKRAKLAALDEELRRKSETIRQFDSKSREVRRLDAKLNEINEEIDRASRLPMRLRVGMTREEAMEIVSDLPARDLGGDCVQARQYFLLFDGGFLSSLVRLGSGDRFNRVVRSCADARNGGKNVALR